MKRPARTVPGTPAPLHARDGFFRAMGGGDQVWQLLASIPDVDCFAKDMHGRFVAMSPGALARVGLKTEADVIGLTDADIHPPTVAKAITEDDARIMQTGTPLLNRVEALYSLTNARDWFLTTKWPVRNTEGNVIGVIGIVRPCLEGRGAAELDPRMARVVEMIHSRHHEALAVADLAKIAHLSTRQLNRHFQETFRMNPQAFVLRTRIHAAGADLLHTDKSMAQIAADHGFCDQSAFTRQFRRHTGETPLHYRRRRAGLTTDPPAPQ